MKLTLTNSQIETMTKTEALNKAAQEVGYGDYDHFLLVVASGTLQNKEVDEIIHRAMDIYAGGWISVEERLPDDEHNVLAVLDGQVCVMAYFSFWEKGERNMVWGYSYDGVNGDAIFDDNYYPTHWKPLPTAP